MGGASITQFGHTRNYYFNTPSAPAPAIPHNLFAQNSPMEIQTPFSRVHTCTHAHQHTKLTDCRRARFYKFAIIIANFILHRLALKCTIQTHAPRNCALTQPRSNSLPRVCMTVCVRVCPLLLIRKPA
uniref:(northern house mosquito) hypothetical protein n=1 Tax=Culex pipiens TaxID=7175 RepID=A0A8D8CPQ9_CULPI